VSLVNYYLEKTTTETQRLRPTNTPKRKYYKTTIIILLRRREWTRPDKLGRLLADYASNPIKLCSVRVTLSRFLTFYLMSFLPICLFYLYVFSTYIDWGVWIGVHFCSTSEKAAIFIRWPAWLSKRARAHNVSLFSYLQRWLLTLTGRLTGHKSSSFSALSYLWAGKMPSNRLKIPQSGFLPHSTRRDYVVLIDVSAVKAS
jgi:hypothetical protein